MCQSAMQVRQRVNAGCCERIPVPDRVPGFGVRDKIDNKTPCNPVAGSESLC